MFRPPNKIWTLVFVGIVFALPLPPAGHSLADKDGTPLQPQVPEVGEVRQEGIGGSEKAAKPTAQVEEVDVAALEARVLARLRHQMHADVDDVAMQAMERAIRQLRDRDGQPVARPLGKVLRLTFALEPALPGVAPVSVMTRTSSYSAFADTAMGETMFRLNVAGDLALKGLHHDRVILDFSTLLQFQDNEKNESGSSGAGGSAELTIGRSEVLMSVGARDLVLTVSEVR